MSTQEREVALLPHQLEFIEDTTTRYLALCGGYGCGKTFAFIIKSIMMAFANPGREGAMLEPTIDMAKRILVPDMCRLLEDLEIQYIYKKADKVFLILCEDGQYSKVHVLSGENYTRLVGLNLAWFGVDEVDTIKQEIAEDMYNVLISRIRDKKASLIQGFFTSTPEGFKFLYEKFEREINESIKDPFIKEITNRRLIRGRTEDNPHLADGYIDNLKNDYTSSQCQAYLNGEFVNFNTNTVYYSFNMETNHSDYKIEDFPSHIIHIGMDFNINKMAAIIHIEKDGLPIAVDEIQRVLNTEAMINEINRRYPGRKIIVYPDASGKNQKTSSVITDHILLKKAGYKVRPPGKKNPRVKDRVTTMNGMLCNARGIRKYLINTNTCPVFSQCLLQQGYDRNGDPDKRNDLDHSNDAAGYYIYTKYPLVSKAQVRIR